MAYPLLKRAFDIVFAAAGLLVLLPLGMTIVLLIKVTNHGPIFYGQSRVGQFGRTFRIWKFRSMVMNADKVGAIVTQGQDPRITRLGRFLRKTKLDELPQLWNVLVGDMSFVGPRPEVPRYVQFYTPEQRTVLRFKPGITDIASLLFRTEEDLLCGAEDVEAFYVRYCLPRKIALNLQYAERASFLRDLRVILQTLLCVLHPVRSIGRRDVAVCHTCSHPGSKEVAVIGTGELATQLALDLQSRETPKRKVVAFFDDDPRTWHKRPQDIPVVGMPECLLNGQWPARLSEVIVALPRDRSERVRQLTELLRPLNLKITLVSGWPMPLEA